MRDDLVDLNQEEFKLQK
jgi:hypothetical protein